MIRLQIEHFSTDSKIQALVNKYWLLDEDNKFVHNAQHLANEAGFTDYRTFNPYLQQFFKVSIACQTCRENIYLKTRASFNEISSKWYYQEKIECSKCHKANLLSSRQISQSVGDQSLAFKPLGEIFIIMDGPVYKLTGNTYPVYQKFKEAGFKWNGVEKIWYSTDPYQVLPFKQYCNDEAKASLEGLNDKFRIIQLPEGSFKAVDNVLPYAALLKKAGFIQNNQSEWVSADPYIVRELLTYCEEQLHAFLLSLPQQLIITFKDGVFIAHGYLRPYKNQLEKNGFTLQGIEWINKNYQQIDPFIEFCDAKARKAIEKAEKSIKNSRATRTNAKIAVPEGLEYLPFQKAGIHYARQRINTLIADEMGLGKTIQGIGIINADKKINTVLIVCPASLKINWFRELNKWLVRSYSIAILKSNQPAPKADIYIINYDILSKFQALIHSNIWDLFIADECHYLKNPDSKRSQLIFGQEPKLPSTAQSNQIKDLNKGGRGVRAKRSIFLTGTPITNRPKEIYPLIHYLFPEVFPTFFPFAQRYCNAKQNYFGWDFSGHSNLEELQDILRANGMIRRLKKEVLKELPPKFRQIIVLPNTKENHKEEGILSRTKENLFQLQGKVELAKTLGNEEEYRKALKEFILAQQAALAEISKIRHHTARHKVKYVIEHVNNALEEEGKKIVIFAHHSDVIDEYKQAFGSSAVKVTGGCSPKQRQESVDKFQNDDSIRVFIGSIQAAGLGITLTASSHVVFAEIDWVPANMSQAEDRCHRIGQKQHVLIQHLVLENSIDAEIVEIIINKQQVIDQALDVKSPRLQQILPEEYIDSDRMYLTIEEVDSYLQSKLNSNINSPNYPTELNLESIDIPIFRLLFEREGPFMNNLGYSAQGIKKNKVNYAIKGEKIGPLRKNRSKNGKE